MNYRNPKYNFDETIDCEINHPIYGWIPFTASKNDVEESGRQIYQEILSGGSIAPYEPPPPPSYEVMAEQVRDMRNQLLLQSDWTQLPDVPIETKSAWEIYRQQLRDITNQSGFPYEVQFPEMPT
jgi:hypothetical protein